MAAAFRALGAVAWVTLAFVACAGSEPTRESVSLVGVWDWIGFSDHGVNGTTTGTATFSGDGTVSFIGTITYPNEPTDSVVVAGTFQQTGNTVVLALGSESATWTVSASGDEVVLTMVGPSPTNTIRLRRPQR